MTDKEIIFYIDHYNYKVSQILNKPKMDISVAFTRAQTIAGQCKRMSSSNSAIVKMSRILADIRTPEETKNTIVHELCHAYNEHHDGHGYYWKQIAKKVGDALGINITRLFYMNNDQVENMANVRSPIGLIEVPEIGFKKYVYKKCRGYNMEYKGWYFSHSGKKYPVKFTKLG